MTKTAIAPKIKVGVLFLKKLEEMKSDKVTKEITYREFKQYVREYIVNDLVIKYLTKEVAVDIIQNFKQFSVDLVAEGVVSFRVDGDVLSLTAQGLDLANDFAVTFEATIKNLEDYIEAEVNDILNRMGVKHAKIALTNNFDKSRGYIETAVNQEAALYTNLNGERYVVVFGIGVFKLNNVNEYRPKLSALQTIEE